MADVGRQARGAFRRKTLLLALARRRALGLRRALDLLGALGLRVVARAVVGPGRHVSLPVLFPVVAPGEKGRVVRPQSAVDPAADA